MALAVTSVPRAVAVGDFHVVHEAPMPDGEDPVASGQAGMLKDGSCTLNNIPDLSLAPTVVLVSAWQCFAVRQSHLVDCLDDFGRGI